MGWNKDADRQVEMVKIRSKCVRELIRRHREEFEEIYDKALREAGIIRQTEGAKLKLTPEIRTIIDDLHKKGLTTTQIQVKLAVDHGVEVSGSSVTKYINGYIHKD